MDQATAISIPEAETAASITLSGDQATEFMGLEPGDEVTLQLTGKDEKAGTVTFEKLTDEAPGDVEPGPKPAIGEAEAEPLAGEETPEEEAAEEKVLGYKRPKVKKESPKISAEDLED